MENETAMMLKKIHVRLTGTNARGAQVIDVDLGEVSIRDVVDLIAIYLSKPDVADVEHPVRLIFDVGAARDS